MKIELSQYDITDAILRALKLGEGTWQVRWHITDTGVSMTVMKCTETKCACGVTKLHTAGPACYTPDEGDER